LTGRLAAPHFRWIHWGILTPTLGGLIVGLALHYWVPGAVGSGVPQVKFAGDASFFNTAIVMPNRLKLFYPDLFIHSRNFSARAP
jgi:H+/Cl- antiporter ClcA